MKTIFNFTWRLLDSRFVYHLCFMLVATVVLFWGIPKLQLDLAWLDPAIWQLLLLSLLSFMGAAALAWYLQRWAWQALALPSILHICSLFKALASWQQFVFFWASYALLLLAAVGCLMAIF